MGRRERLFGSRFDRHSRFGFHDDAIARMSDRRPGFKDYQFDPKLRTFARFKTITEAQAKIKEKIALKDCGDRLS
jgi:hypothetical protein